MDLFEAVAATPWLVPVLLGSAVVALAVATPLGRFLRAGRWHAVLLVAGLGLLVGATLTPGLGQTFSLGTCLAGVDGSLITNDWFRADLARNVLLTVPLGLGVGLVRPPRRRRLVLGALLLVPAVEVVQLLVPSLGRACQVTDVAANLVGLVAAMVVGAVAERSARPRRGGRLAPSTDDGRVPVRSG